MSQLITWDELRKLVVYEPKTGKFFACINLGKSTKSGDEMGSLSRALGYVIIGIRRRKYWAHRLAWFYVMGEWPTADIDHINGNRSDNRWVNLREATRSQNLANSNARTNKLGEKNIRKRKNRYSVYVRKNGRMHEKFCATLEEAKILRRAMLKKYHGEFACLS